MSDRPEFGCRFVKMADGTLLDPAAVEAIQPKYPDGRASDVWLACGARLLVEEEPDVVAHAVTVGTEGFSMKPELQGPVGFVQTNGRFSSEAAHDAIKGYAQIGSVL